VTDWRGEVKDNNARPLLLFPRYVGILSTIYTSLWNARSENNGKFLQIPSLDAVSTANSAPVPLLHITTTERQFTSRDFRLPPPCRQNLRSTGMLCSVEWQFCTDVSGQPIDPIFKGQDLDP
jgi:hypothetical protein